MHGPSCHELLTRDIEFAISTKWCALREGRYRRATASPENDSGTFIFESFSRMHGGGDEPSVEQVAEQHQVDRVGTRRLGSLLDHSLGRHADHDCVHGSRSMGTATQPG